MNQLRPLLGALAVIAALLTAGCDLCWPRGGELARCLSDDDDAADDDDSGDDDDAADDDDATAPRPPCEHGEIVPGIPFTSDIGDGPQAETYDFVCVHGDSFFMGYDNDDPAWEEGSERHEVTLTRVYLLGQWEVPQALWTEIIGSNPSECFEPEGCTDLSPVNRVSWQASRDFADALSALEGFQRASTDLGGIQSQDLDRDGYRLPTEAEWEFAAQAGQETVYSGSNDVDEVAWCDAFTDVYPKPVGLKDANAWGFHDMSGNINEWCFDGWGPYDLEPQTDPIGASNQNFRVRRGGTFDYQCDLTRVRERSFDTPTSGYNKGLRLARTVFVPTK